MLGKYPGKSLHRVGVFIAGAWITSNVINLLLPEQINFNYQNSPKESARDSIKKQLTILIIELSEGNKFKNNLLKRTISEDRKKSNFMLYNLDQKNKLEIIKIQSNKKLNISDSKYALTLDESYRLGDVALAADHIKQIIKLPNSSPERYIIIGRSTLKRINIFLDQELNKNEQLYKKNIDSKFWEMRYNIYSHKKRHRGNKLVSDPSSSKEIKEILNKITKINNLKKRKDFKYMPNIIEDLSNILYKDSQTNLSISEMKNIISFTIKDYHDIILKEFKL